MKIFSLIFMVVYLFGCNAGNENVAYSESTAMVEDAVNQTETAKMDVDKDLQQSMLIKRGNVAFQTDNVEQKHHQIIAMVQKFGGYVSNDNNYITSDRKTFNTEVRLPKQNFDNFLTELSKGVAHYDHKEISVEDVTEEFVDIQARLKTKKELEARYIELLGKAKTVSEMLEIEKQIGELQSDIESIEGRMKYLTQQVQFSTLHISYYQKTAVGNQFGQQFLNGFKNGWNNLIWFFVGLVNIWPFILIFGVMLFLFIKWLRRRK